jgi:hypothetical protein
MPKIVDGIKIIFSDYVVRPKVSGGVRTGSKEWYICE